MIQLSLLSQRIMTCLLFKYVDDIIFGVTNVSFCEKFAKSMHSEFEISKMGEVNIVLGLQIKQLKEDTFIN